MIKKHFPFIFFFCLCPLLSQEKILPTVLNEFHNLFYLHESNTLNQHLGDLKSYPMRDGIWLRSSFNELLTQPNSTFLKSKTRSTLSQMGYNHAFSTKNGVNFLGFNIDYAYSWLDFSNKKENMHSFGFALYDTFINPNHFYINTALKYTVIYPSATPLFTKTFVHLISANLEIGQKLIFSSVFFLQPLLKTSIGFMPSITLASPTHSLKTQNTMPLFIKTGSYIGVGYWGKIRGDLRFGTFFDGDFFFFSSPTLDANKLGQRENYRLNLELSTNVHIGKSLRLYLGAQTSFFGESNINYGANLGIRFIFGNPVYLQPQKRRNDRSTRTIQSIQKNLRYEGDASIARVEERTHLTQGQVEERYTTQAKRNSPYIQDDIKYTKRQRFLRESSQWIDIKQNEENYQNRNAPQMQMRDIGIIHDYRQRELERKYGKD